MTTLASPPPPEAPPAVAKTKQKRRDALQATILVSISLDLSDPNSYPNAVKAIEGMKDGLPAGASFTAKPRLAKV